MKKKKKMASYKCAVSELSKCNGKTETRRDALAKELAAIGANVSGTIEELESRITNFHKVPGVYEALQEDRRKRRRTKVFGRELDEIVPTTSGSWKGDTFPSFTKEQLSSYVRPKLPGSSSWLKRGLNFFNSHKIVTIRSYQPHSEDDVLWVRAYVQRSFGNTERPAYVKFVRGQAVGGYCSCKIGKSGLCGHIIAILYILKHKTETGHFKIFSSTTSQPQKWHKKGKRCDLHMGPIMSINTRLGTPSEKKRGKPGIYQ